MVGEPENKLQSLTFYYKLKAGCWYFFFNLQNDSYYFKSSLNLMLFQARGSRQSQPLTLFIDIIITIIIVELPILSLICLLLHIQFN